MLLRGKRALPGARHSLETLQKLGAPFVLLTNGGGVTERAKADSLSKTLGVKIDASQVVLAHTPLKGMNELKQSRVLVLGCHDELAVARDYGFERVVSPQELAAQHPLYYPWDHFTPVAPTTVDAHAHEPIAAILVMHDPVDWHLELQICLDVIRRRFPPSAARAPPPLVYNTNDDIEFSSSCPHPRLAQGTFVRCLELLHGLAHVDANDAPAKLPLAVKRFGKPHGVQFTFAEAAMSSPDRLYMIGDNPAADIRGANNAGDKWTSILVLSGMTSAPVAGGGSDEPDVVAPNVEAAVAEILKRERAFVG